jgi:hypothetical protein
MAVFLSLRINNRDNIDDKETRRRFLGNVFFFVSTDF